jgi:hypothetical protein
MPSLLSDSKSSPQGLLVTTQMWRVDYDQHGVYFEYLHPSFLHANATYRTNRGVFSPHLLSATVIQLEIVGGDGLVVPS